MFSKYRIKRTDADIKPEETLLDVLSEHPIMETPLSSETFRNFYIILIIVVSVLFLKSFELQVIKKEHFRAVARRSNPSYYWSAAPRGLIYDARGSLVADNIKVFDLVIFNTNQPDLINETNEAFEKLGKIIGLDKGDIIRIFQRNQGAAVFLLKKNLQQVQAEKIKSLNLKNIHLVPGFQRRYPKKAVLASVLGYTAKVSPTDLENDDYYLINDRVGRLGAEQYYEKDLRGGHGALILGTDGEQIEAPAGKKLVLNIESAVQEKLFLSLANVLAANGLRRGAAIAQNPETGAVLALVSLPSFDPNIFEDSADPINVEKIGKILQDKNKPLFNRVVSGHYSPGSTIKPLLALAGLKEKIVTTDTKIYANGSISVKSRYDPNIVYTFNDWKVHGLTDLKKAIADSVDVYFYILGGGYGETRGLGITTIVDYFKNFLADRALEIDLPGEIDGFVPTPQWKKSEKGEDWFIGDTYNVSIGQGDLLVTPIWLNSYIGAIANGGRFMKPIVVNTVKGAKEEILRQNLPQEIFHLPFSADEIGVVREGMRQTVTSGTATILQEVSVPVAAKTGTVQVAGRSLNSVIVAFAPYDKPEIVLTILVENTQRQGLANAVAHEFLSWYFSK